MLFVQGFQEVYQIHVHDAYTRFLGMRRCISSYAYDIKSRYLKAVNRQTLSGVIIDGLVMS